MLSIPIHTRPASLSLNMYAPESIGSGCRSMSTSAVASATNPSANLAFFYPFVLHEKTAYLRAWVYNGATASGNWDVGVYSDAFVRLGSTGAIAQTGTSVLQATDFAITLNPGRYYYAVSFSSATATFFGLTVVAAQARVLGVAEAASAHVLPDNPTMAGFARTLMPHFGLMRRTLVV